MSSPSAPTPPAKPPIDQAGGDADPTAATAPPAWWPEGEAWPPPRWPGRHGTWGAENWRHRGGRRKGWRPFGCLFLLFGLFAAGTMVIGLWAAAAIVGLVEAPPIVVGAGLVAFVVIALGAFGAARAFRRMS